MKFKILPILMILITLLTLSSCLITSRDFSYEISCDDFTENNNYVSGLIMEVGDKVRLELCSNQTAGFEWSYEMTVENVVKEEDHDFEEPEEGLAGAAGKELWTFEATETGTTEIHMDYSQSWEGGLQSEWTYTLYITVEEVSED